MAICPFSESIFLSSSCLTKSLDFNKLIQELELYFQTVKKIKFEDIKKKLDIPKKDYLRKFNLEEKNLNNILYLPEILKLAEEIKENNFNEFNLFIM